MKNEVYNAKRKYLLIAFALALAACSPQYATHYTMLPPPTASGQLCSTNVQAMSNTCLANCQQMASNCRSGQAALNIGYNIGRNRDPFYNSGANFSDRDCSATQCEDSCMNAARQGHVNCGGTVQADTVCVRNCPKPQ